MLFRSVNERLFMRVARSAELIVVPRTTHLVTAMRPAVFDAVLNLVRTDPEETVRLAGLAADGGTFVSTTFPDLDDAGRGVRVVSASVRSDAAQLAELVALVDAGDLRMHVAGRRPLTDLAAVHDEAVAGRLVGKTVLIP